MVQRDKLTKYMRAGLLQEKKKLLAQEEVRIDRLVKDINYNLYPLQGIESIEIAAAEQAMKELIAAHARWKHLKEEIKKLEQEE